MILKFFLGFFLFFAFSIKSESLKLYYSHSLNGNLHACTCTAIPIAGLSRRHSYLQSRKWNPSDSVLIELGDFFALSDSLEKKNAILESFQMLGYSALIPGKNELTYTKADFWKNWKNFPLVLSNLEEKNFIGTSKIGNTVNIISKKSKKIGIVSLYGNKFISKLPDSVSKTYKVRTDSEFVSGILGNSGIDLWVFIFQEYEELNESFLQKLPENSLFLLAGKTPGMDGSGRFKIGSKILYGTSGVNGDEIGEIEYDVSSRKIINQKKTTIDVDKFPDSTEILKIAEKYGIKP